MGAAYAYAFCWQLLLVVVVVTMVIRTKKGPGKVDSLNVACQSEVIVPAWALACVCAQIDTSCIATA